MWIGITAVLLAAVEPGVRSTASIGDWADCVIADAVAHVASVEPPDIVADDALGTCRRFATAFRKAIIRDYVAAGRPDAEDSALLFTEEIRQTLHRNTVKLIRKERRRDMSRK